MLLPILSLIQILLNSPGFWTHSWSAFWSLRTCSGLLAMSTSIMISRNSSSPASHSCWTSSPPENCKMSFFLAKNKKKCQVRGRCDVSFLWPHPLGICIPVLSDTKHNYLYWKTINFTLKGALPLFAAARRIVKNALEIWQIYKMWLPTWAKGERHGTEDWLTTDRGWRRISMIKTMMTIVQKVFTKNASQKWGFICPGLMFQQYLCLGKPNAFFRDAKKETS